jgi:cytochrome c oxidase cbb3-type subunit I
MQTQDNPTDPAADNLLRATIDRSVKAPVLFFFLNAAFWLVASTVMGVLAAIKLVNPGFICDCAALTYGRLQPAHLSALVYGWAMQAAFGVALWVMARRTANPLRSGQGAMVTLGILWNVAITVGIIAILSGYQTGIEWLEMPRGIWFAMAVIVSVISYRLLSMAARSQRATGFMVSTWYMVAAALWIVWILWTAVTFLSADMQLGALGTGISAWYVHALILLFFVPVGVGSSYYFIPKITGRPIASSQLASLGFWTLAIFAGWTGFQRYAGGALPAWMTAVGSFAGVFLLIPVGVVGINHHLTTLGKHKLVMVSPTLLFTFCGALFYPLCGIALALISMNQAGFASNFQFTHAWYGYQIAAIYAFFSMSAFGAIYYIVPRLSGCEWLSARLIKSHFWFSVYGIGTIVLASLVGGIAQGGSLNDPFNWDSSFIKVVQNSYPYLVARAVAWLFILWSNVMFLVHLVFMAAGLGRRSAQPTLLAHEEVDHIHHTPVTAEV